MIEVSRDIRGRIFEVGVIDDKHVNIMITKQHGLRGGHVHDYPEEFAVVIGEIDWAEAPTPNVNNVTRATIGQSAHAPRADRLRRRGVPPRGHRVQGQGLRADESTYQGTAR